MAKISTYPQPTPPQLGDYIIGTDISDLLMTKNFLLSDIITLATTTNQFVTIVGDQTITGSKTINVTSGIALNVSSGTSISDIAINTGSYIGIGIQSGTYGGTAVKASASSVGGIAVKAEGNNGSTGLYLKGELSIEGNVGAANNVFKSKGPGVSPAWVPESKGYFYNSATQSFITANVGVPLTLPSYLPDNTSGIVVSSDGSALNRITFSVAGSYRVSPNVTIVNTVTPSAQVYIWLRKNGVDLPLTARVFSIGSTLVYQNFSLDYAVSVNSSDYIQIMCSASNANLLIAAEGSTVDRPAIPSSVVTINSI
jgi:hypothetical protein